MGTFILSVFLLIAVADIIYSFKKLEEPEDDLELYGYKNVKRKRKIKIKINFV